jgi:hypothetical protein
MSDCRVVTALERCTLSAVTCWNRNVYVSLCCTHVKAQPLSGMEPDPSLGHNIVKNWPQDNQVLNRKNVLLRLAFGKPRVFSLSSAYSIAWSTA